VVNVANGSDETPSSRARDFGIGGAVMGAEWNRFIDNTPVRIALIVAGFGLWAVVVVGALAAA